MMGKFDIFVGYLAYELGKVNTKEIFSETKVYERSYGEIYKTEVISTYYNEVGVVFSVEETDEYIALEYFEKQQAEIYGTIDLNEFDQQFQLLTQKKDATFAQLKEAFRIVETFKKDIHRFEQIFDPTEMTTTEQAKTEKQYHELRQLKQNIDYLERILNTTTF